MKSTRYTEEQIIRILQEVHSGKAVAFPSASSGERITKYSGLPHSGGLAG